MEDAKIIDLYFERSQDAITETSNKYGRACLAISKNILSDLQDAQECVNDTYLGAWNAIPPARPDPLSAFLFRITRNISLTRYHKNTAAKRDSRCTVSFEELQDTLGTQEGPEEYAQREELRQTIEGFLDRLSPENRVIFLRRYWFFDDYSQIARRTRLTEKIISMRLVRMRKKLKQHLEKEGFLL